MITPLLVRVDPGVLSDIITVCPTLNAAELPLARAGLKLGPGLGIVQVATVVAAPAAAGDVQFWYFMCSLPCSAHLIRSELEGISAPTSLRKDDTLLFPYLSNSFS